MAGRSEFWLSAIQPHDKDEKCLDALLDGINEVNLRGEADFGQPVGREML